MSKIIIVALIFSLASFTFAQEMDFSSFALSRTPDLKTIKAAGKIKYVNWENCTTEKSHFLVLCKFLDHVPKEADFHIEGYQKVDCDGNVFNVTTKEKANSVFACELILKENRKQYDMKYKSIPTLLKEYKVKREEDFTKFKAVGQLGYTWPDCELEQKNYELYCGIFENIPETDEIKIEKYKMDINCTGNEINIESKGVKDHYLTCLIYRKTDESIIDKISSGTPSLNTENWSMKIGKDLTKNELRGDNRLEWKTCNLNNEVMDYRITCGFYKDVPKHDDFLKSYEMDMELECGGWPWQVMWTKDNSYKYWGCMTYGREDKAIADLQYVEIPGIDVTKVDINEDKDYKYKVVSSKIVYKWSKCEDVKDDYGYVCDWFSSIPTYKDIVDRKDKIKDIVCDGNDVESTSKGLEDGYFGCGIIRRKVNDLLSFDYITIRSIDIQEVALYVNDNKINAKGNINLNWANCEDERNDYKLVLNFLDHSPAVDEKWDGKEIRIKCGKTEISNEFTSNLQNVYFAVKLMKGDVIYDVESIKLPSFEIGGLDFTFTNQYYDHRIISGFVPIDFPNCERSHNQYSMICDFSSKIPTYDSLMKGFANKIVCDAWELQGLTSLGTDDNIFGCMMIENESKKMVELKYVELGGLDMKDLKIKHNDNDKITVNGILKYKLGSDSKAEDFHYSCKLSSEIPTESTFKYEESEVINLDGNEINIFENKNRFFGCILYRSNDKGVIDIKYMELPEFNVNHLHLEPNKNSHLWVPEGDITYEWSSCGLNQEKFELACEYSDSEPKSVNYEKATKFNIVCSGTNLTSFTTDLTDNIYLGCSLIRKDDKEVFDFHFIKGQQHDQSDSSKVWTIVATAAGCVVGLVIIVGLVCLFVKRMNGGKKDLIESNNTTEAQPENAQNQSLISNEQA